MINELTRVITRWLRSHPTDGVGPRLAAREIAEPENTRLLVQPGDHRFPLTVFNDVDDECVAKRYEPDKVPALVLVGEYSTKAPVKALRGANAEIRFPAVELSIAYLEGEVRTTHARQRCGYVLEAVQESLALFADPSRSKVAIDDSGPTTWRESGDCEVYDITAFEEFRLTGGIGNTTLFGTLLATCAVRRRLTS